MKKRRVGLSVLFIYVCYNLTSLEFHAMDNNFGDIAYRVFVTKAIAFDKEELGVDATTCTYMFTIKVKTKCFDF